MARPRRTNSFVRGAQDAWRPLALHCLPLRPLRAACVLAWSSCIVTGSLFALPADLSLGPIRPELGDAGLSLTGKVHAQALADFSCALQFEASGQMREALKHYLRVFQADPSNAALAAHTAELALRYEGLDRAKAILEEAVEANSAQAEPYLHLATFCLTYGADDPGLSSRAISAVTTALRKFPLNSGVYSVAVSAYLTTQERAKAVEVMQKAADQSSEDPEYWLEVGRAAQRVWPLGEAGARAEHLDQVNPFFEKALVMAKGEDDASSEAQLEVAKYFLLSNQPERSLEICEELAKRPDGLVARKLLYRLYDARDMDDLALSVLEKIVAEVPGDVEQRRLLAGAYQERQEFEKAIPQLEAAIQVGGGSASDYLTLGEMLAHTRQYERLLQLTSRSVTLFPDNSIFQWQAAVANRALEKWDDAVEHFVAAERLAQSSQPELLNHRFFFQYGITLESAGQHESADRMLEKSITMTPPDDVEAAATAMNYLGYMWLERDHQIDKAGELIVKANELEAENPAYIDSLGWFHFKKRDYPKALEALQHAEALLNDLQPEDAEILEHIAQVLEKMTRTKEALDYLRRAEALGSPDPEVQKRIHDGLKRLSPKEPAKTSSPEGEEKKPAKVPTQSL